MTAPFTEHLALLASSPNGVASLRSLVRELAASGALIEQNEADESANEILIRTAKAKKQLGIMPTKPSTGASSSREIPRGWVNTRFEMICLEASTGPFGSLIHKSDYVRGGVPLVNPSHMINGRIVADPDVSVTPLMAATLSAYRLTAADMVLARRGEVGRVARVTADENGWLCGTGSFRLRFTEDISREFMSLLFTCSSSRKYLARAAVGTTMVNLNHGVLASMPIALPPLAEQYRIVAKVDELMALCDRLEARQQDAEAAHTQLVQVLLSSLTEARDAKAFQASWERVAGQFETLFTTESSIDRLWRSVLDIAAQGRLVSGDADTPRVPIAEVLTGDTLNGCSHKPSDAPDGTPILRISAATGSQDFVVDEFDHKWVTLTDVEREKFRLKPNDLLACRFNGNLRFVGAFAIYRGGSSLDPVFPDKLIRFRVNPHRVLADYLRFVMNALPARSQIESLCATTVGNIGISATNLKTVMVRVPTLEEQRRIVDSLSALLSVCSKLKSCLKASRLQHAKLAEAIVAEALTASI